MPPPERRGPPCDGPDCYMNGPCHPGCNPKTEAVQHSSVPSHTEQVESTKGSPGAQWRRRLREFTVWVLLVASAVTALSYLVGGVQTLIDLISKFP